MPVCVFDNPATGQRECWQDGELILALSMGLLLQKSSARIRIPFIANIGPWITGQLIGDETALNN